MKQSTTLWQKPVNTEVPFTPGEWSAPHFCSCDTTCNCGNVFSEFQRGMGAICEVFFDNEQDEHSDEYELREVAEANGRLISMAPRMFHVLDRVQSFDLPEDVLEEIADILHIVSKKPVGLPRTIVE